MGSTHTSLGFRAGIRRVCAVAGLLAVGSLGLANTASAVRGEPPEGTWRCVSVGHGYYATWVSTGSAWSYAGITRCYTP